MLLYLLWLQGGEAGPVSNGGPGMGLSFYLCISSARAACFCFSNWRRAWVLYTVTTDDTRNCLATFRPLPKTHKLPRQVASAIPSHKAVLWDWEERQSTGRKSTVVRTPEICDPIPELLCDKPQSLSVVNERNAVCWASQSPRVVKTRHSTHWDILGTPET